MGCTDCGRKGGCDSRKHGMFAAVDEALARLYPTRRWGERDEATALGQGFSSEEGEALASAIAQRLGTAALYQPGGADEWCDYIYVLCLGRVPCIAEIRAGVAALPPDLDDTAEPLDADGDLLVEDGGATGLDERYLRVALSSLARFAGVQEVAMTLRRAPGRGGTREGNGGGDIVVTERARSGVFDPVLLPRFQSLVAVFAEWEIRHLDFGEIVEPPADFQPADYADRFGGEPVIANYLFYPQPPTTVSTVVLTDAGAAGAVTSGA
ncbi:MAG: hypothetical protein ABUS79_07895 [Pseudomonadota bacterium]